MGKATTKTARNNAVQAGFTIIEVLIVLAIAGMIILIVFQAIPALERSSRNNQRKQDVASVLQAVSRYELNHSGNMPNSASDLAIFLQQNNELTYYSDLSGPGAQIFFTAEPAGTLLGANSQNPDINTVDIYNHQVCSTDGQTATSTNAGYNNVVALYALESGNSGVSPQCQQL